LDSLSQLLFLAMRFVSVACAAFLHCSDAFRVSRSSYTTIAGIPVINYRYLQLQPVVDFESNEYDWIIKFKSEISDEHVQEFCEDHCKSMGHPSKGGLPLATVSASEEKLESLLKRHPGMVEFVEPDSPVAVEPHSYMEEEAEHGLYSLDLINLADAAYTGKGAHIYVVDTGIRVSHDDFGGRAVATYDGFGSKECQPGESDCAADNHGHGTHVAGTAGGNTFGVASDAILHAVKVCCAGGFVANEGMDWIAQFAKKPAVMTMSLGSYTTPESSRVAVDAVVNSGVTVTVSAGNRGTDSCQKSYTFIASAFGVGASDHANVRAKLSNFGTCNAIFAPGVTIVSASHTSDDGTAVMSGTSMAAPLAAGAAALLLEETPTLTPRRVRRVLRRRATRKALAGLKAGDPNLLLNVASSYRAPPARGTWDVVGTGCNISRDGRCVFSINHPANYSDSQSCQIRITGNVSVVVKAFSTERGWDTLTMGGLSYSGRNKPPRGVYRGSILWSSDQAIASSGWKLCKR